MVTEFGAEANRTGPFEERGTYEFQSDFLDFHLRTYATKPWLSGAITMLQEFWCRPDWSGGNPEAAVAASTRRASSTTTATPSRPPRSSATGSGARSSTTSRRAG